MDKNHMSDALLKFIEAQKIFPHNREILFYQCSSLIMQYLKDTKNKAFEKARKSLNSAVEIMESGLTSHKNDHFIIFFNGILKLFAQDFMTAMQFFNKSITLNEESNAKYFLARGITYACTSMFQEAVKDLSTALRLKDDLYLAYLNRGKCAYLLEDPNLAFSDYQKLVQLKSEDPYIHIYAGNLLMTAGSYEEAIKSFTTAFKIHPIVRALYQRARVSLNNKKFSVILHYQIWRKHLTTLMQFIK